MACRDYIRDYCRIGRPGMSCLALPGCRKMDKEEGEEGRVLGSVGSLSYFSDFFFFIVFFFFLLSPRSRDESKQWVQECPVY